MEPMVRSPRHTVALVFILLLAGGGLAGCLDDGSDGLEPEEPLVTEPAVGHVITDRKNTVDTPGYDLLRTVVAETSEDLVVSLELAVLGEDWRHVAPGEHAIYWVFWNVGDHQEQVGLFVRNVHGVLTTNAIHQKYGTAEGCNDWTLCRVAVDLEIEYGEPGRITWTVPRDELMDGRQGARLLNIGMVTAVESGQPGSVIGDERSTPSEGEIAAPPLCTPCGYNRNNPWTWNYRTIEAAGGKEHTFTFETPMMNRTIAPQGPSRVDFTTQPAGERQEAHRPDVDLLGVHYREDTENFTFGVRVSLVEEQPSDHAMFIAFGMPSGRVHQAGYETIQDYREMESWSGYCEPSEDEQCHWQNHPVEITREPGRPGWVNFTFSLGDLGSPQEGQRLNHAQVWSRPHDTVASLEAPQAGPLGTAGVFVSDTENSDPRFGFGPDHRFRLSDPAEGIAERVRERLGHLVEDTAGDAEVPADMQILEAATEQSQEAQFDIISAKASGRDPQTLELSIGIRDLSRVTVPTGYDAMIYAVAIETGGVDSMAFYHQDGNGFGYYLAEDSLVTVPEKSDPRPLPWNEIEGLHSTSGRASDNAGGSEYGGTFTFYIPHEMIGASPGERFNVSALGAGTYLLRDENQPTDLIEELDRADAPESDLPFLLGMEETPMGPTGEVARTPWYDNPYWDILGIGVAVLLTGLGAFAVWRRRRKLSRYLGLVDQASRTENLEERESRLAEIRRAVREDLVHGRISEGHYTVVLEHIREALGKLRLHAFEKTFQELPLKVVNKIRTILKDGMVSDHEIETVEALVKETKIPGEDKQKVLERLGRWQKKDEENTG